MARHGSRGLSSYKYDALLALMAQSAAENNYAGFVSPEVGKEFINNVNAITAANVGNGYGMLSGQGAIQHQGIGERIYQRDADLFANAAKQGLRVSYQSSGEPRATESGENFKLGFDQASNGLLANAVVAPNNPADNNSGKNFDKNTTTLYFHKTDNPDGTQKTGEAKERAERYQQFVANDGGIAEAEENVTNDPSMTTASHNLLSQIFTDDFLASIGKEEGQRIWYNTADGTKKGAANCAAGADPAKDANACGDAKKKIASEQDAAMDLYNLYIIAADMEQENTGSTRSISTSTSKVSTPRRRRRLLGRLMPRTSMRRDRGAQVRMRPTALPSRCSTISSMRSTRGSGPAPPRRSDSHMPKPLFRLRHC